VPEALSPGVKFTTNLHLVPRLRMREAIPPLLNTPSWRGGQLKKSRGTTLPLTFC